MTRSRRAGLVLLALTLAAAADPSVQGAQRSQKEVSRELSGFVGEHFADQGGAGDAGELARRKRTREQRVLEILVAGQLASLDDWNHAGVVLQYSDDVEEILLSLVLLLRPAVEDLSQARQLYAFALDHYLANLDRAMPFGTMLEAAGPADVLAIDAAGEPLPDSIRRFFTLAPLQGRAAKKGKKPNARELTALLAAPTDAEVETFLPRVREIVASGVLESGKDLVAAATLLLRSPVERDLLVAHVVATCAAFEDHPKALPLSLKALDRYLLATKRGQLLGTVQGSEGTPRESPRLAPAVIRKGYGLEAAGPAVR